jgi:hypothetical protein
MRWTKCGAVIVICAASLAMIGVTPTGAASRAVHPLLHRNQGPVAPPGYAVVTSAPIANPPQGQSLGAVTCPVGTVVLGGGARSSSTSTAVNISSSFPESKTTWSVTMNNAGSAHSGATFVVYAVCAKRPKQYVIVSGSTFIEPNSLSFQSANCPARSELLGGGADPNSTDLGVNISGEGPNLELVYGGWFVAMGNSGTEQVITTAYAICGQEKAVTYTNVFGGDIAGGQLGVTALCPGTTVPFSGGVVVGGGDPSVANNSSFPVTGGWSGVENNGGTIGYALQAAGVCGS